MNIVQFNSYEIDDKGYNHLTTGSEKEAFNLYEITENLEEYYRQKAPNLWNAWIRTNNMLVEQQERLDKQGVKLNNLNTALNNLNKKLDILINQQQK